VEGLASGVSPSYAVTCQVVSYCSYALTSCPKLRKEQQDKVKFKSPHHIQRTYPMERSPTFRLPNTEVGSDCREFAGRTATRLILLILRTIIPASFPELRNGDSETRNLMRKESHYHLAAHQFLGLSET